MCEYEETFKGKTILVTGGAGAIGGEQQFLPGQAPQPSAGPVGLRVA